MKLIHPEHLPPADAIQKKSIKPVICYPVSDLLGALSACPGGDCGTEHSSDKSSCHPLKVEVYRPLASPAGWQPSLPIGYDRTHGA